MVNHGLQLVAAGIALGFVAALGATRWLSSLLYKTRSVDPMTFLAVPVVLLAVAVVACLIPAHRASGASIRSSRCAAISAPGPL